MAVFIIATVGVACSGFFFINLCHRRKYDFVRLFGCRAWLERRRQRRSGGAATALEGVRFGVLIEDIVIPCCFLLAKLLLLNCSYGFLSGARKKLCQNGIKTIWTWSSFRVNHATANLK